MSKQSTFNISLRLLTQQFTKGLNGVQRQLKTFGNFVKGAFAIGSLVAFGRKIVDVGAQFQDAMARVQAVSNATAREMDMMTKKAEELGATTKYTSAEAAGALENLTRNGMSASDATTTLSGVLKFAQANAIGLAESADIVSNTLNMFGMNAEDATKVTDILSATAANSATNVTQLSEALVNAAPVAKTLGLSLEETSSMLGALAQRGVKGAAAGTQMRMALIKMVDPKVSAALKKYGVDIDENTIKTEGLVGVLKRLKDANLNMTQLTEVFKSRQAAGIQQMIDSYDDLVRMMGVTGAAAGTTARMFEQGVGTTEMAIKSLQSAYEGLMNSIFKRTSGVLNGVIKALTNVVRALSDTKTRTVAIIGAVASALTIKLIVAMNKVKEKALETNVAMTTLKAGITTVTAAAKAAYAAMGGWVGILVTVGSLIATSVVSSLQSAKKGFSDLARAEADARAEAETEKKTLDRLYRILTDTTKPLEIRQKALDEIKRRAPEYLGYLDKEGKLINDNKIALDNYCTALEASLVLKAREAHLNELIVKKERELQKAYELEKEGPSFLDKMSSYASGVGGGGSATGGYYSGTVKSAEEIHKERIQQHYDKADQLQEEIDTYEKEMIDKAYEKVLASQTNNNNNNNNNTPGTVKDVKDDLDNANRKYIETMAILRNKMEEQIISEDEFKKEKTKAEETLLDAYLQYKHAVLGKNEKKTALSSKEEQYYEELLDEYSLEMFAAKAIAIAKERQLKYEKKVEENAKKRAQNFEELDKAKTRLDTKDAKSDIKNPWNDFSTNPKEYKAQEKVVQDLEKEAERLIAAYEGVKDVLAEVGEGRTEKEKATIEYWKEIEKRVHDVTQEYYAQADALGKLKAEEAINELTVERTYQWYNAVKSTSSAIGTLATSLDNLANANWSDMSFAEKFNTLSNAIFGTVDAIVSVMESFKSLQEIITALSFAKQEYQRIEDESAARQVAAAEAVGAAELQKAAEIAAAAEIEAGANLALKEAQRIKVSANSAEAISGAASAMASIPYVGPALATAAATEMAALLAAILPKFANGGIIQGGSKYGDRLLARVNAGEMILNQKQQRRLFDIANGRGSIGPGQVEFILSGKVLKGVLRNVDSANSRISGSQGL